jgi:chitinase
MTSTTRPRNVIYFNDTLNGTISLADIVSLPYTDVILCFLLVDGNLNVYGDGGAFDGNTGNLSNPGDVQALQNAGKNVLVSFGGDPGTFPTPAWENCAQNVDLLVNNIVNFVKENNLNGVDIDYEDDAGFTGAYEGVQFLVALTSGLAAQLPADKNIITHAPVTPYWDPNAMYGNAYTQIWQQVGGTIAWINNQFYDQGSPYDNDDAAKVQWYQNIANLTGPQKLLMGALINNGNDDPGEGSITVQDMVQNVIPQLQSIYGSSEVGGVMGWQFSSDTAGTWAPGISSALGSTPSHGQPSICVFHQGESSDGQLWYSVYYDNNWYADTQIPNAGLGGFPSAAVWAGGISVLYQGSGNDGQLWNSYSTDGTSWYSSTQVPNVGMSASPSVVFYNGNLYVFHQGSSNNGQLWYSVYDGTNANWIGDRQVPNAGMSGSPSAVAWAGGISVFYQGLGDDSQLWVSYSTDGTNWYASTQVPNVGITDSPSAVVYNGKLYVFHQGSGNNEELWYFVFDGTNWGPDTQIQHVGMSGSPSAVAWAGGISVFHQGHGASGANSTLWVSFSNDGTNWYPDTLVAGVGLTDSPSAVVFG